MSGKPPTIEWYIARDGAQHGPISDAEMRKFVELGHLRGTDLVWCANFKEWCSGAQAFPEHFGPAKPSRPPAGANDQSPAPAVGSPPVPAPAAQPHAARSASVVASQVRPDDDAAWAKAMHEVVENRPGAARSGSPAHPQDLDPRGSSHPAALHVPNGLDGDEITPARAKRGWIGVATAALAVILIASGLGWIAWQNRSLVSGASAIGSAIIQQTPAAAPASDHLKLPPYFVPGQTKEQIDAAMQQVAIWRYLKNEFGDWYQEILTDVERMRAQKNSEAAITQYLVNVVVTLRRRNALAALQSSPDHLKAMATAFIANLKQLGTRDGATCYAFITHGEASPFMIELSRTPAFAETLQKQMIAVFSAIVDARAARKIHPNTRRTDYDALTEDLIKQRGWTQQDLATFSDPQKLSTTPPDRVCTLVQDWFTAQLALKDQELQTRLLAESLKPLVGG